MSEEEIVFKNKENKQVYELLSKLIELRNNMNNSKGAARIRATREHDAYFNFMVKRFTYIAELHTRRYMKFPNYKDLLQEGLLGLVMALNKFDMERSKNFFRIANWYVKTRVKRSANKFDIISVPMAIGKEAAMCRIDTPVIQDNIPNQSEQIEKNQQSEIMKTTISEFPFEHQKVLFYYYGFNMIGNEVMLADKKTISEISKELNMSRPKIKRIIDTTSKKITQALT